MSGQRSAALVLGYRIERQVAYDADGRSHATRYDVRCPHSGEIIGQAQSLRMARRLVLMRELRDFDRAARRQSQSIGQSFAA